MSRDNHEKIFRNQKGFILPTALLLLILGSLLVVPSLYLLQTSLNAGNVVDMNTKALYSADAGVEHALWRLSYDTTLTLPAVNGSVQWTLPDQASVMNGASVSVTLLNQGNGVYKVTSAATRTDGHNATIETYLNFSPSGSSVFNKAVVGLNGDITMSGSACVYSTPGGGNGDVYANGNVSLSASASIDGDASATGTVSTSGSAHVGGTKTSGATPLDAAAVATAMNTLINNWKAMAQNVTCATCSTGYTRTGSTWSAPAGTYNNNEYVQNNMSISGSSGTWVFNGNVCVGAYTTKDLTISGGGTITFNGKLKVGEDLSISNYGGSVIFNDTVCIGRDLNISSGIPVTFKKGVSVGRNANLSAYGNAITLNSSLYVVGNMELTSSAQLVSSCPSGPISSLSCPIYVHGYIHTGNSSRLDGGQNVIADGNVTVDGSSQINSSVSSQYIPFIISTAGNVTIGNSGNAMKAIVYAPAASPNGVINFSGSAILTGAAVGRTVTLGNSGVVIYPEAFQTRTDLPITIGVGTGGGWSIQVYKVL